jgi:hypothetical protein
MQNAFPLESDSLIIRKMIDAITQERTIFSIYEEAIKCTVNL